MQSNYLSFNVEIKNVKFVTEEGKVFPKTAIVSFQYADKPIPSVELFGYFDTEIIYKLIEENQPVDLSYCYIRDFSLSDYRNSRNLEKKEYIIIKSFNAQHALFDSQFNSDFSYGHFLDGKVSFENSHFAGGKIKFTGAKFGPGAKNFAYSVFVNGNIDFSNVEFGEGDVIFKNSVFKNGIKDFQYANFGKGSVSFVNTEFNEGDVSFINVIFNSDDVSFKVARFGPGKIDFHYAKFRGTDICFERTEFGNGKVDFRKVEFNEGKVNFNRALFGDGEKSFEESEFHNGKFNFKSVDLGIGDLNFEMSDFTGVEMFFDKSTFGRGVISFRNSKSDVLSIKSCHLDHYLDLRLAKCNYLDVSDTIVRDIIDFKPYDFKVDIGTINFSGMRLIGHLYIDWEQNNVRQSIIRQHDISLKLKAEQFRILKENFRSTGQYKDEDLAYVEFKRYEMKAYLHETLQKNPVSAIWEYPSYFFQWLIFDKVGLYATSPMRVLISVFFVYLGFSLTYILLPLFFDTHIQSTVGNPDHMSVVSLGLYHSAITFFTIGYGDTYPYGILRIFCGFEGFCGVFMMSYFTVAFVRKILR